MDLENLISAYNFSKEVAPMSEIVPKQKQKLRKNDTSIVSDFILKLKHVSDLPTWQVSGSVATHIIAFWTWRGLFVPAIVATRWPWTWVVIQYPLTRSGSSTATATEWDEVASRSGVSLSSFLDVGLPFLFADPPEKILFKILQL